MSCKKKAFESLEDAGIKLNKIKEEEGDNKKPIRAYLCPNCEKYHLTSFTNKLQKKVVEIHKSIEKHKLNKEAWSLIKKKQRNKNKEPKISKKLTRTLL